MYLMVCNISTTFGFEPVYDRRKASPRESEGKETENREPDTTMGKGADVDCCKILCLGGLAFACFQMCCGGRTQQQGPGYGYEK